jgi:hypothetical protein
MYHGLPLDIIHGLEIGILHWRNKPKWNIIVGKYE